MEDPAADFRRNLLEKLTLMSRSGQKHEKKRLIFEKLDSHSNDPISFISSAET